MGNAAHRVRLMEVTPERRRALTVVDHLGGRIRGAAITKGQGTTSV